jgi:hypothetical protein
MLIPIKAELAINTILVGIVIISFMIASVLVRRFSSNGCTSRSEANILNPSARKIDPDALNQSTSMTRSSDSILSRRSSMRFTEEIESIVISNRSSPAELVILITDLCVKNYDAATALYFKGRDMGVLSSVSVNADMFLNLCSSCIRVGSPHFVFKYFSEMDDYHINRDLSFYNSIIKILTFKRYYKINLSISDMFLNLTAADRDSSSDMENLRSIYSCMLYSSVETREFWRSSKFFKQIIRTGIAPSEKDFANATRAIIDREDWINGFKLITSGSEVDSTSVCHLMKVVLQKDPTCLAQIIRLSHTTSSLCALLTALIRDHSLDEYMDSISRKILSDSSLVCQEFLSGLVGVIDTLSHQEKSRMNTGLIVDKLIDVALSAPFSRLGESLVLLLNSIMTLVLKKESMCSGLNSRIRNRIIPVFKKSLVVGQQTNPALLPDLASYSLLFKSVSHSSLSDAMDIYRMFESQSDAGFIVGNVTLFNDCLVAIASQVNPKTPSSVSRYVWTVANGLVNDMISRGIYPTNQTCGLLVNVLVKLAAAGPHDHEYYFQECLSLLTVTIVKEYDLVPDMKLFVQAVTGAIVQGHMRWVNRLFSAMVDQHRANKVGKRKEDEFGVVFSDCEEENEDGITVETVNYLLKVSAKIDSSVEIFLMLVELVLINKLSMRIEAVLKSLKPLSGKSKERLFGILKKYKYKLSRSNLC